MAEKNNRNLNSAKQEKNDEFYTLYEDIENECRHYTSYFKDKIIYCNCDNPLFSNFVKYFILNYKRLGLRKFICTCYSNVENFNDIDPLDFYGDEKHINASNASHNKSLKIVLPDCLSSVGFESLTASEIYELLINDIKSEKFSYVKTLKGDGDFRSEECIDILKDVDIVVTNPPFSLFKDLVGLLEKYKKHYLLIGNKNAITYKEVYPHIKDNELWLGYTCPEKFIQPDGDIEKIMSGLTKWFTNINTGKTHKPLKLTCKYNPIEYPKYDNFDAIVIDKTKNIPEDYYGAMGVPITFLDKYCSEQFEFVTFRKNSSGKQLVFSREMEYEFNRTFVSPYDMDNTVSAERRKIYEGNIKAYNQDIEPIDYFFPCINFIWGVMTNDDETLVNGKNIYKHILIRRKGNNTISHEETIKNESIEDLDEISLW